jgi:hypothetical protein
VTGDMTAPRVGIEEGARVRGALRTEEPAAQSSPRAEQRRGAPRTLEMPRRAEAPAAPARPHGAEAPAPRSAVASASPPPAAAHKRPPPAPVVPAFRGLQARKKKVRGR